MKAVAEGGAPLTREEMQQLRWLLGGALSALGAGAVWQMDIGVGLLPALVLAGIVAAVWRPALPGLVPGWAQVAAFPALAAFVAADLWLRGEMLPAMVRLALLLLLLRNFSYRRRREDLQVAVLGLFPVIVAGVMTVSLVFVAQILAYAACTLALLLTITLDEMGGADRPASPREDHAVRGWARHVSWLHLWRRLREVTDWRMVGMGAGVFAGMVGFSVLLFLAIPRFQLESGMFLDRLITKKARTGFTDTIRLGDVTDIQQDHGLALSVDVSDQAKVPATPYWRMLVLDEYRDGVFRMSGGLRAKEFLAERTGAAHVGSVPAGKGDGLVWTFYLESGVSRFLPLSGPYERLRFRETQSFRHAPRLALNALRQEPASMTAYRVEGFLTTGVLPDAAFAERWRGEESARGREVQARLPVLGDGDVAMLRRTMEDITGQEGRLAAGEFARKAGEWLRRRHAYALTSALPPGGDGDPLVRWMVSRTGGHCEFFAGSVVLLARAAGLPARVVTGFRGGSWNAYSNNFTIRNSDAHAWAEIFDEAAGGWLRVDPLAPDDAERGGETTGAAALAARLDRGWTARLDSLRVFWYRRVVSFDQRTQEEALRATKEAAVSFGQWLAGALASVERWLTRPWSAARMLVTLAALAALGLAAWGWREGGWRLGWLRPGRGGRGGDPVRREAGRWLRRLGVGEGTGAEFHAAIAELQCVRFGRREGWPERPERLFRRARRLARAGRKRITPT